MSATPLEATVQQHRTPARRSRSPATSTAAPATRSTRPTPRSPATTRVLLDFSARRLHQLDRHRPDRRACSARARAQGRPVSACGLSEHYREIFEITRLSDFMTILADEHDARRRPRRRAMTDTTIRLEVRTPRPGCSVIELAGEVTGASEARPVGRLRTGRDATARARSCSTSAACST